MIRELLVWHVDNLSRIALGTIEFLVFSRLSYKKSDVNCFLIILSSLYFIYSAEVLFLYFYGTFSRSPKVFNLEILPETLI